MIAILPATSNSAIGLFVTIPNLEKIFDAQVPVLLTLPPGAAGSVADQL